MAENDPWLNWGWLKVGPFTPTDEERVAADRRRSELEAQERVAAQGGIHSLMPPKNVRRKAGPPMLTPEQKAAAQQAMPQAQPRQFMDTPVGPDERGSPGAWENWSAWDKTKGLLGIGGFGEAADNSYKNYLDSQRVVPSDETVPYEGPVGPDEAAKRSVAPGENPAVAPTDVAANPVLSPEQQAIEDIKRQKAMIDSIYPQRPVDDTAQNAADAYAMDERDRAKQMAMLAFFSGVTQGAGGNWEGVGKGLAGAGGAYSEGFARYQKALQGKAERASDRLNQGYEDQVSRTDAAVKLYGAEKDREKEMLSEARLRGKERSDQIDEYFKERLKIAGGNDFAPPDQSLTDRIMRSWRLSRERGDIVELEDVADKPSS